MQILLAAATKSRSEKAKTQKRKTQNAKRKNTKTQKATAGGYPPATFLVCFINIYRDRYIFIYVQIYTASAKALRYAGQLP